MRFILATLILASGGSLPAFAQDSAPQPITPRWVLKNAGPRAAPVVVGAFTPDGRQFVAAGTDRAIQVWDTTTGKAAFTLAKGRNPPECLLFSPDGKLLIAGERNQTVTLWEWAKRKPVATLEGFQGSVRWCALAADGRKLLTAT